MNFTRSLACSLALLPAAASAEEPLSAAASDPAETGWMQGFPPPADKVIRFSDDDAMAFPKSRWTFSHFRELVPTHAVDRGPGAASELPERLDDGLDAVTFTPLGGGEEMTWGEAFGVNYTDGVIVLHHGAVVYERYGGALDADGLHGAMSVTKSLAGVLAETLIAEGELDENAAVGDLIPELEDSAFGDATVRQVLDMTTALDYSEDYADPDAEIWQFAAAGNPLPKPDDYDGPRSFYGFLQTVEKDGEHGEVFSYDTPNAELVGWLIARTTGESAADLLSERVWSRIGAEREGFFTVDSIGTPSTGGGFNGNLRDMARFGQLMLDGGRVGGEQVIPVAAIESIRTGGDPEKFAPSGHDTLPGWSYKSLWWVSHNDHGAYAARGVYGQTVWVDPTADVVIARFGSHPVAANAANDPTSLPAYHAVAEHLMQNDPAPLLGRAWSIGSVGGEEVVEGSEPELTFGRDGRLSGTTGCNRFFGEWEADEGELSVSNLGSTRMACPPELMDQEKRVLDLLAAVERFEVREDGSLVLTSSDNGSLTATR